MRSQAAIAALMLLPLTALAQQTAYGQCGGTGWSGATDCVSGFACVNLNPYYSQCQPGTAAPGTTLSTARTTSKPTTTVSSGGSGSTGTGTTPGTTLYSGYYWIRAVEDPNFHKYLQTSPTYSTGAAIMADYTTAGQFQIVDGQLVELVDVAKGTLLYANVGQPVNSSDTKLPVTFSKTKNTYGTFQFSGDAVQWSVAGISRPNLSAWLVCGSQQLFVNLGAYGYMTPAGCADETIHYYNAAIASS